MTNSIPEPQNVFRPRHPFDASHYPKLVLLPAFNKTHLPGFDKFLHRLFCSQMLADIAQGRLWAYTAAQERCTVRTFLDPIIGTGKFKDITEPQCGTVMCSVLQKIQEGALKVSSAQGTYTADSLLAYLQMRRGQPLR